MSSLDNFQHLEDQNRYSELERHLHKPPTSQEQSPERAQTILWNEYEVGDLIGSGSFGHVYKCRNLKTGKHYAIKKFKNKFPTQKKAFEQREIQILQRFDQNKRTHCPYVMKAERIEYDNRRLYLVFECMDMSLTQYIKKRGRKGLIKLDEKHEILTIMKQLLLGLQYMHDVLGIMHRDLKPDNIMISENPLQIKIIDFGTCKDLTVEQGPHTSYVSTRWYRAPECVLRSHEYEFVSDVFAAGCIMSELYLQRPLFPGTSEIDQIDKIFRVLGTPSKEQWREGYRLGEKRNLEFNQYPKKILSKYLDGIGEDALEAVKLMLKISAQKRGTATQVLQLPFFTLSDLVTPSTQESRNKQSPDFSQHSPPQGLLSSRSEFHRMAGEGQDPSHFVRTFYRYKDGQGPNSTGDRSSSGYRPPHNKQHLFQSRDSSSGTRLEATKMVHRSSKMRLDQIQNLPQVSMARGTINNRNQLSQSNSNFSISPRPNVMHDRSHSRGFSRTTQDPFNTSNQFSGKIDKNLRKIQGMKIPQYNYNAVQSVVGPPMSPGMKRLRNNSQAERVDSRSSYTHDPFRKNYQAMKNERAMEWQHNLPGYQSPIYSQQSNGVRPGSRPNHANFHQRPHLNDSYNSPRINVQSQKYITSVPSRGIPQKQGGTRRYTYNPKPVYRSPEKRGPSYGGSEYEQSSFVEYQTLARAMPESSISGASRGASNNNRRGYWGS